MILFACLFVYFSISLVFVCFFSRSRQEYQEHCLAASKSQLLMKQFFNFLKSHHNAMLTRDQLIEFDFTDKQISTLIRTGVLSLRTIVGEWNSLVYFAVNLT